MFKHILLPTDGSELSKKAIDGGLELAKAIGARVTAYVCLEEYPYTPFSEIVVEAPQAFKERIENQARLYDFGTYPGLVLDAAAGPVAGDIYDIPDALLPVLDEIEEVYPGQATLFVRETQPVTLAGAAAACLLYPVADSAVMGLARIDSGDWVAYRRARDAATA